MLGASDGLSISAIFPLTTNFPYARVMNRIKKKNTMKERVGQKLVRKFLTACLHFTEKP